MIEWHKPKNTTGYYETTGVRALDGVTVKVSIRRQGGFGGKKSLGWWEVASHAVGDDVMFILCEHPTAPTAKKWVAERLLRSGSSSQDSPASPVG